MTPATIRDVPALAWLVASRSVSGTPNVLTRIALLPVALLLVYGLLPLLHHRDRQSAVALTGPLRRAVQSPATCLMQAALTVTGIIVVSTGAALLPALVVLVAVWILSGWTLISCAVMIATLPGQARRSGPRGDWKIGMLVARPGTHAIIDAARLAGELVRPGETVAVVARDAKLARIYRRYGFAPTTPGALALTYRRDVAADAAPAAENARRTS